MEAINNQVRGEMCQFTIGNGHVCGANTASDGYGSPLPACQEHLDAWMQAYVPVHVPVLPTFRDWVLQTRRVPMRTAPEPHVEDDGENSVVPTPSAPVALTRFDEFLSPAPTARRAPVSFEDIPLCIDPERECCVCADDTRLLSLPCRHTTCFSCYERLPRQTCPVCRSEIIASFVRRL